MLASPLWRLLNLAWWLLALILAVLLFRRRNRQSTVARSTLVVLTTEVLAVSTMAAAFVLEPTLWTLFDKGIVGLPDALSVFMTFSGLLHYAIEPALLPASAMALAVAIAKTHASCMFLSAVANAVILVAFDIAIRMRSTDISAPLPFSVLGDLVGGAPVGAVIGHFGFSSAGWNPRRLSLRHASVGLIAFGAVLSAGMGGYLLFFYYLPDPVVLDIREWETVSFEYTGLHLPYSSPLGELATGFPISAGGAGWLTGPIGGHGSLDVGDNRHDKQGTPERVSLTVAELAIDVSENIGDPSALLAGAHIKFNGEIPSGKLAVDSKPFNMVLLLLGKPKDHLYDALFLLGGKDSKIRMTKDPRVIVLLALDGLGAMLYPHMSRDIKSNPRDLLSVFTGDDAQLKVSGIQQAIVFVGLPPNLQWIMGKEGPAQFRITLPDGVVVQADNQPFRRKNGAAGARGVALVLGKGSDPATKTVVAA